MSGNFLFFFFFALVQTIKFILAKRPHSGRSVQVDGGFSWQREEALSTSAPALSRELHHAAQFYTHNYRVGLAQPQQVEFQVTLAVPPG